MLPYHRPLLAMARIAATPELGHFHSPFPSSTIGAISSHHLMVLRTILAAFSSKAS
jgi:hypothetical protein